MNALVLLLTLTSTLVLQSGDRIPVEGKPVEKDGVITFRSGGMLYSMPAAEVARIESETPESENVVPISAKADEKKQTPRRKPVSEEERRRLLAELEKNHTGTPPPPTQAPPRLDPLPTREEAREAKREEQQWRREARVHEENIRRANEEVELLETRIEEYQRKIQSFISLGYKPHQFTYDSSQLQQAIEALPYARLEVTRAVRAYDQFREDARREGIMPGWLR
jgi:type IV secretory pathway VirB10-like protein